jgi:hypothetical protein
VLESQPSAPVRREDLEWPTLARPDAVEGHRVRLVDHHGLAIAAVHGVVDLCIATTTVRRRICSAVELADAVFAHQRGDDLDGIAVAHDEVMVELLVQVSEAAGEEPPPVVAGTIPQAVVDDEQGDDLVTLVEGASECAVVRQPQVAPEPDDAPPGIPCG